MQLIHTYDGGIWDRLVQHIGRDEPTEFFIASPFHDLDSEVCHRLAKLWPRASIELLVQQGYTNLQTVSLQNLRSIRLSELVNDSRRLHAKLLAWRGATSGGCLVGSANFTSAALDGRNVEAGLLLRDSNKLVDALFDRNLAKRSLSIDDFEPGNEDPPESVIAIPALRIDSALLTDGNILRVSYSRQLEPVPSTLKVTIRTPGEARPRKSLGVPNETSKSVSLQLEDEVLADAHGTLLATLVAELNSKKIESPRHDISYLVLKHLDSYSAFWTHNLSVVPSDYLHRRGTRTRDPTKKKINKARKNLTRFRALS